VYTSAGRKEGANGRKSERRGERRGRGVRRGVSCRLIKMAFGESEEADECHRAGAAGGVISPTDCAPVD
jgi:hypothetical protein